MRQVIGYRLWAMAEYLSVFIILPIAYSLLPAIACATTITADYLEYFKDEDKYIATGNVWIETEETVLVADKVVMHQKTLDVEAWGNVTYEDKDTLINTEHAEINMDTKKGRLYNAVILFKKDNYWVSGNDMVKIKENHYYAKTAVFTTCDMDASKTPDWCVKGNNVDIIIGKRVTADNVTYRVKGLPLLYTPFFMAPVKTKRETGFLFPVIGNSSDKGFQFSPSFFWAIDDNKDATFYLDYYGSRGIGKGLEYRYVEPNSKGTWHTYHIGDKKFNEDFFELKGFNEFDLQEMRGYIDLGYVNRNDFYKEYSYIRDQRILRFLQSSGEISIPKNSGRTYFLAQYWIDLQDNSGTNVSSGTRGVPQRLPEIGHVINPKNVGPLMFTMSSSLANFYREKEPRGQRLDIHPRFSYSFGDKVSVFQSISVRATAYNLSNGSIYGSSPHRETFEYRANALARFSKRYESFSHNIEPSVSYTFIPQTHQLPTFDSTERFNKTSVAGVSLYNGFNFERFAIAASLGQSIDFNAGDRPLSPTTLQASFSGPFAVNFDMSHNFNTGRTETVNTSVSFNVAEKTSMTVGERYTASNNQYYYNFGVNSVLSKKLSASFNTYGDSKLGLRDTTINAVYTEQCWSLNIMAARRPGDNTRPAEYSIFVVAQLKGLEQPIKLYHYQTDTTKQ